MLVLMHSGDVSELGYDLETLEINTTASSLRPLADIEARLWDETKQTWMDDDIIVPVTPDLLAAWKGLKHLLPEARVYGTGKSAHQDSPFSRQAINWPQIAEAELEQMVAKRKSQHNAEATYGAKSQDHDLQDEDESLTTDSAITAEEIIRGEKELKEKLRAARDA